MSASRNTNPQIPLPASLEGLHPHARALWLCGSTRMLYAADFLFRQGSATPAQVAAALDCTLDEADRALGELIAAGAASRVVQAGGGQWAKNYRPAAGT